MMMILVRRLVFSIQAGARSGRVCILGLASLLALTTAASALGGDGVTTVTFPTGNVKTTSLSADISEPRIADAHWGGLMKMKDEVVDFGKKRISISQYGGDENNYYRIYAYTKDQIFLLEAAEMFFEMQITSAEPVAGTWFKQDGEVFCDKSAVPCQVKIQWEILLEDEDAPY